MSIRSKYILSLLLLTGVCLAIYILLAKSVFERDKRRSVLASNQQISVILADSFDEILHLSEESGLAARVSPANLSSRLGMKFTPEAGGSFLADGTKAISEDPLFPQVMANGLAQTILSSSDLEIPKVIAFEDQQFLVASKALKSKDLRVFTVTPETKALHGLNVLYLKSLQYFCLVVCLVLAVSFFLAHSLLGNLDKIILAAHQISKGNFDYRLRLKGKDEFGDVAYSFQHMSEEIRRLVLETAEKARMQNELTTAQTVHETLFPALGFASEGVEIEGLYRSASECGGDWWYYFEHPTGLYVLICDATGHGAPAAMITAAAKAAIHLAKRDPQLSLKKLTESFNYALYQTAHGKILMTGFLIQILPDRTVHYVNASHEPPLIISKDPKTQTDSVLNFVLEPVGPRFGQAPESSFQIGILEDMSGKMLLLYTDGITSQKNSDGRELGDRRFNTFLTAMNPLVCNLNELNQKSFELIDQYRGTEAQADDLTLVSIRFHNHSS